MAPNVKDGEGEYHHRDEALRRHAVTSLHLAQPADAADQDDDDDYDDEKPE